MSNLKRRVRVLENLLHDYISFISDLYKISGTYSSRVNKEDVCHYGFIPSSSEYSLNTLISLYDYIKNTSDRFVDRSTLFLDIGCGIGNVVVMAGRVGFDAEGLEYNKKIYKVAKRFAGGYNKCHIIKGNMLTFRNYHKYDILYYYEPIANREVMLSFANRLAKKMKVGAYVIPNGANPFKGMKAFRRVLSKYHYVYEKITEV